MNNVDPAIGLDINNPTDFPAIQQYLMQYEPKVEQSEQDVEGRASETVKLQQRAELLQQTIPSDYPRPPECWVATCLR